MRSAFAAASLLALTALVPPPAGAESRQAPRASQRAEAFHHYQIPVGTALLLKLRTPLDSATARVDDQVDATFWSPVIQEGAELIPVGSVISGRVTAVVRASKRTPAGSVTFALSMVQHAGTEDRATLPTQPITIAAPAEPPARGRRVRGRRPADAVMEAGMSFIAVTVEPLIVRIPK